MTIRTTGDPDAVTMTMRATARRLGLSLTKTYELAYAGHLPGAFRLGARGRWLVHRAVFEDGLERLARGQTVTPQEPDALLERAYDDLSRRRASRS